MSKAGPSGPSPVPPVGCTACQEGLALQMSLRMAFQPIVNVADGQIFAYEALVRGPEGQGAAWVMAQVHQDNMYAFDQACRVEAIRSAARLGLPQRGPEVRLSINFLPNAVYEPATCIRATLKTAREVGFPLERLMFEITEHESLLDESQVRRIIDAYRGFGFVTALDDYGSGHATAGMLLAMKPDIVKIDLAMVRDVHQDPWRLSMVQHLVGFAAEVGLLLIAEGVETLEEARTLAALGITHMQGYLFARPELEALPEVSQALLRSCLPTP